ncbi:hypothetical protein V5F77_23045 [Xanthobacter sp. DSM 24535]|uniref:tetratricopeptide repeat protein n=1 Tax=Roseixanthobacter psychrophilus TaxID=3119917 RepID=UPI00372C72C8
MDHQENAARKIWIRPDLDSDPQAGRAPVFDPAREIFAPSAIESLRSEVERLREDLRQTAPRAAVREIGRVLTHLHGQMVEVQAVEPARIAADLNDIKLCLGILSAGEQQKDGLAAAIDGLSHKVDLLKAEAVEPEALARLQVQTAELKDLVGRALDEGSALSKIDANSRADLLRVGEDVVQRIEVTGAAMERSTRDLIARLDGASGPDSASEAIQQQLTEVKVRLADLSEQMGAAVGSSPLAEKVSLLLERLEQGGPQADALQPLADALERHVAVLAERVQISAEHQARLDGIEANLHALTEELERFRHASADVSAEAVQAVAMRLSARDDAPAVIGLKRGLAALEARQQEFERRTQDFFAAEAELGLHDLAEQEMVRPPRRASEPTQERETQERSPQGAGPQDLRADPGPRFDPTRPVFDGTPDEADFEMFEPQAVPATAAEGGQAESPAGPSMHTAPVVEPVTRPILAKRSACVAREDRAISKARSTSRKRAVVNDKKRGIPAAGRAALIAAALGVAIVGAVQVSGPASTFAHAFGHAVATTAAQVAASLEARAAMSAPRVAVGPAGAAVAAAAKLDTPPPVNAPPLSALPPPIGAPALRAAALGGNASAAYEVGMRYTDGKGTDMNPVAGVKWLSYAVSKGSVPAAFQLGSLYEYNNRDYEQARALYTWAAERGNLRAMHNLGVLASEGADGKSDWPGAIHWFRMAADRGLRDSQHNLGVIYSRGLGGAPDLGEAWKWFALAANQGDSESARKRDDVVGRTDAETLRRAQAAVVAFTPIAADVAANASQSPPEWNQPSADDAAPRTVSAKSSS